LRNQEKKPFTKQKHRQIKEYFYLQLRIGSAKSKKEAITLTAGHFFVCTSTVEHVVGAISPEFLAEDGQGKALEPKPDSDSGQIERSPMKTGNIAQSNTHVD
jgi:hypothetical protein